MYICNITGQSFDLDDNEKTRELAVRFGFNSRFRAICYVFTRLFYGECKILYTLPPNKNLNGIGMSDSGWANILAEKFNYTNTFYHTSPYLDIYNEDHIKNYDNLDFIISSDVFEHIDPFPSVQTAFDNVHKILIAGGYFIFSVPFTNGEHIEHFPNLYKYHLEKNENDEYMLFNTTIDNKIETFTNLCFHGGPGNVLEMRVFSKDSIISFLEKSGFIDITFYEINEDMNKYGIFWSPDNNDTCSLIISARKPGVPTFGNLRYRNAEIPNAHLQKILFR
jgi:SAM-dependent methyltransferase